MSHIWQYPPPNQVPPPLLLPVSPILPLSILLLYQSTTAITTTAFATTTTELEWHSIYHHHCYNYYTCHFNSHWHCYCYSTTPATTTTVKQSNLLLTVIFSLALCQLRYIYSHLDSTCQSFQLLQL